MIRALSACFAANLFHQVTPICYLVDEISLQPVSSKDKLKKGKTVQLKHMTSGYIYMAENAYVKLNFAPT